MKTYHFNEIMIIRSNIVNIIINNQSPQESFRTIKVEVKEKNIGIFGT